MNINRGLILIGAIDNSEIHSYFGEPPQSLLGIATTKKEIDALDKLNS